MNIDLILKLLSVSGNVMTLSEAERFLLAHGADGSVDSARIINGLVQKRFLTRNQRKIKLNLMEIRKTLHHAINV
jgi:hypothetical protein